MRKYGKNYRKFPENKKRLSDRNRRIVVNLEDTYVRQKIRQLTGLESKYITPQMVELKRELMLFKRLERGIANGINSGGDKRTQTDAKAA